MEWPETIYNKQEMTWNDLQWARRNDLKQPTMSKKLREQPRARKKRHRTAYLLWTRNNLKQPTISKEQPEMTCKEQILTSWNPLFEKYQLEGSDVTKKQ